MRTRKQKNEDEFRGLIIRWDLARTNKPLDEITAGDVPPGLDADDVCALNPDGSLMLTRHDHSRVIHGRCHQTDRYPDSCLVYPDWKLR